MKMSKGRLSAADRRQQIIEQAVKVFARHGVEGTRTRDIAEECGINEALLYRHFASKEDIYRKALMFTGGKGDRHPFCYCVSAQ